MKISRKVFSGMFLLLTVIFLSGFFSAYMSSNFPVSTLYRDSESKSICQEGTDFIIQITPFGCTPAVVRSDLLEDSDVPVYCQLGATKINPLIDVEAIDSISFSGTKSPQISSIGFHPAKAALGIEGQLNSPVLNNIGYVVIMLKKQTNASAMPSYVTGNLTAKIRYNINNAFGIGKASFYLPEFASEEDFENEKDRYSFWSGRGYLKAENIETDSAQISLYSSSDTKISTVSLKRGESSQSIYLPGFECQAGLKLRLDSLDNANTRAKLRVNAEVVEVSQGERFLDNKCTVRNLQSNGLVERVGLRCQEDTGSKNFDLSISPRLILSVNGVEKEVSLGEKLYENNDKGIYLGYIGAKKNSQQKENLFIYLVSSPQKKASLTEEELSSVSSIVEDLIGAKQESTGIISGTEEALKTFAGLWSRLEKAVVKGETYYRINFNDKEQTFQAGKTSILNFAEPQDKEFANNELRGEYENAKQDYEKIREEFSSEAYKTGTTSYGEEALYKEILLAYEAGQERTMLDLCKDFSEEYPNSAKIIQECSYVFKLSSQEIGEVYLTINKKIKKLSFDGIYEPTFEDYGATILVNAPSNSGSFELRKAESISSTSFSLQLISLNDNSATVKISAKTDKGTKTEIVNLQKEVTNDFETGYSFTLTDVNLKKAAKVSVIPNIDNSGSQANFNFKVGIEKRAIQLTPEKTKEIILKLNKSINTWGGFSEGLGKAVQGLKTACLVTGTALVAKSFIENAQGAGIARQTVMRGTDGWVDKCKQMVAAKTYISQEKCYLENADKIDADVAEMGKVLNEQDSNMKSLQQGITASKFLSQNVVNTSALIEKYSTQQATYLQQNLPATITDPDNKGASISRDEILNIIRTGDGEHKQYSLEQLKEIELYTKILNDASATENLKKIANARLYAVVSDVNTAAKIPTQIATWASSLSVGSDKVSYLASEKVRTLSYEDLTLGSIGKTDLGSADTPVALIQTSDNNKYIVILDKSAGTAIYGIGKVYDFSGNEIAKPSELSNVVFQKYDSSSYKNQYLNAQVRYYETEPYKGMPAIVPFDSSKGWYAATKATIPSGSNIASYDASGRVTSFWVCNVGKNGLEEFQTVGDDICEMVNTGTGQAYNQFPKLSEAEARSLIRKAQDAIEQASKISESQRKGTITIANQRIAVGSPAVDVPEFECQDFMSPKDCLLLFNVCDPVICSSSRCDLGGTYPVKDVVQSGIIGSIALCLPNAKEGIIVPVCLTGVKAGIDGLLSVLTATRDCLQESLDTGKNVGICDEIFSVYMCDFFWKQAIPLADMVIPKIISTVAGQNTRGGGEYLGVASAWSTAEKSVNYFTNYYAVNAKSAFLARTTEGIQGEFCKLFISGIVPSGGDFLNELTEPDSPPQFTGRFEEIEFTTATVPPSSQYKVFYHIFAGKDSGAYYQIYLKGSTSSSYYQDTSSNYKVASGYIAVGEYASETKDFIATSGYKQLCITVNGQEECGFKEVSTSFAVDYIKDKYLASQASETDIKTESECISGTASAYSLLNPNAQSAAESMVDPAIYNQGIIRVCATANPGQGTDANVGTQDARWVDVGYCDNSKTRCWLDTESVKDVIKSTTVEADALGEATNNYLEVLQNQEGYLSKEQVSSAVSEIEKEADKSKKVTLISNIYEKVFWNSQKALLLDLRADTYVEIFRDLLKATPKPEAKLSETNVSEEPITQTQPSTAQTTQTSVYKTVTSAEALKDLNYNDLSQAQTKVVSATQNLVGKSASRTIYKNCWDGAYQSYRDALVGDKCVYSDASGKSYTISNERGTGGQATIATTLYQTGKTFPTFAVYKCTYSSTGSNKFTSQQKMTYIKSGDLLSYAWRSDAGHSAVFIQWKDRANNIAYLFDWNGGTQDNRIFRYYTEDLSDNKHPIYAYWEPVSSGSGSAIDPVVKEIPNSEEIAGSSSSTSSTGGTPAVSNIGDKIWQQAGAIAANHPADSAAKFVSTAIINAGVSGITAAESAAYLASLIEKNSKFQEVNVDSNLNRGDIILLGKACQKDYSIAVFSAFGLNDNTKISLYTNLDGKVDLETTPFTPLISNGIYSYKAYRYIGDLSASEKTSIEPIRAKWTLVNAIQEVDKLLKLPNRNNGGTYLDNKQFVDQLILDGILNEDECKQIRTYFLGLGQKDMSWLKTVLLSKCVTDSLCKSTYELD